MHPSKLLLTTLTLSTLGTGFVQASNLTIVPQVAIQQKNLKFSQDIIQPNGDKLENRGFNTSIPTASLALTTVYDRLFVSIKYETDYHDTYEFAEVAFTNGLSKIDRSDLNLTVGFSIMKGLNAFFGYIDGKTVVRPEPTYLDGVLSDTGDFPDDNKICLNPPDSLGGDGICRPIVRSNLAKDHQLFGLNPYKQTYSENGWFLGASYGLPISDKGTLSGSLAYAWMDGQYEDNYLVGLVEQNEFNYKGRSNGYSAAITWTAPINNYSGYFLDVRRQNYDMNATDQTGLYNDKVETNETMTTLTAGVQFYF